MTTTEIDGAPEPGTVFAGKYRVERLLGAGGMGYVLAARHLQLDERVAIKMLLPHLARKAEIVARFVQEGRSAVKIRSPHVVKVLDVCEAEGVPYLVTEYLDGVDLAGLLAREGKLSPAVAVDHILQAGEAIAEAHKLRIIHRDLKPANLFLVHDARGAPFVKVLDFGISKVLAPEGTDALSMTTTTSTMGSPLYMSPEQLKSSQSVDERTDIWALGVILFELVTGRPPFLARSIAELGALVLVGTAPDVRAFEPEAPPALARAIATCLRHDAEQRFPSMTELAAALAPLGTASARASADIIRRTLDEAPRPTTAWSPGPSAASMGRIGLAETVVDPAQKWGASTDYSSSGAAATAMSRAPRPASSRRWMGAGALALLVAGGVVAGVARPWRPPVGGGASASAWSTSGLPDRDPPRAAIAAESAAPVSGTDAGQSVSVVAAGAGASTTRRPLARPAGPPRGIVVAPSTPEATRPPPGVSSRSSDFSHDRFE